MSALAMGAVLRAAGGRIAAALRWLLGHPWQLTLIVAAAWIAWAQLVTIPNRDATIAEHVETISARTSERDRERANHQLTKRNYALAQLAARRLEEQRLARVAAEQETITDDVAKDYRARLADARGAAERLRGQLARTGDGASGSAAAIPMSGAGGAAGGAAAPPGSDRLPFGADELAWRLKATEQAIQLDELINWVERQAAVDPNR